MREVMNPSPHIRILKGVLKSMFVEIELMYAG
jgi:hypothetical protein